MPDLTGSWGRRNLDLTPRKPDFAQRPLTTVLKVGPKGYIHNWIFVGPQAVGAQVFHPAHGHGTVHRIKDGKVHVRFEGNKKHSFDLPKSPPKAKPKQTDHFSKKPTGKPASAPKPAAKPAPAAKPTTMDGHLVAAQTAIADGRKADAVNHLTAAANLAPDKDAKKKITAMRARLASQVMGKPAPAATDAEVDKHVGEALKNIATGDYDAVVHHLKTAEGLATGEKKADLKEKLDFWVKQRDDHNAKKKPASLPKKPKPTSAALSDMDAAKEIEAAEQIAAAKELLTQGKKSKASDHLLAALDASSSEKTKQQVNEALQSIGWTMQDLSNISQSSGGPTLPGTKKHNMNEPKGVGPKALNKPNYFASELKAKVIKKNEADAWGAKGFTHPSKLKPMEYDSLRAYSGSHYRRINDMLRKFDKPPAGSDMEKSIKSYIREIDKVMKREKVPEDIVTSRSVGLSVFGGDPTKYLGKTFKDDGFMSVSVADQPIGSFGGGQAVLTIEVPKGTPGYYLNGVTKFPEEKELLLARGTELAISKVEKDDKGVWRILAQVVPAQ
jgi:hypothetical protein